MQLIETSCKMGSFSESDILSHRQRGLWIWVHATGCFINFWLAMNSYRVRDTFWTWTPCTTTIFICISTILDILSWRFIFKCILSAMPHRHQSSSVSNLALSAAMFTFLPYFFSWSMSRFPFFVVAKATLIMQNLLLKNGNQIVEEEEAAAAEAE